MSRRILTRPLRLTAIHPTLSHTLPFRASRSFADKTAAERPLENDARLDNEAKGPNMDQLPHISEEAAATSKITGTEGPDVEGQGTPVAEVAKDDDVEKHLPRVMKEEMRKDTTQTQTGNKGARSFSTFARTAFNQTMASRRTFSVTARRQLDVQQHGNTGGLSDGPPPGLVSQSNAVEEDFEDYEEDEVDEEYEVFEDDASDVAKAGLKFDPVGQLGQQSHLRKRYDPLVDQVTKLIMKDGKLAAAQKHMSIILAHLATAPAPRVSTNHKLLLQDAASSDLPLNPVQYLSVAIDSVAPLFRIRNQKGMAGGGMAVQIPVPLSIRQRRRHAVMWILDAVAKKKKAVSPFPKRFAEEIVSIVEGRSSTWERRVALNGIGIRARVNIKLPRRT